VAREQRGGLSPGVGGWIRSLVLACRMRSTASSLGGWMDCRGSSLDRFGWSAGRGAVDGTIACGIGGPWARRGTLPSPADWSRGFGCLGCGRPGRGRAVGPPPPTPLADRIGATGCVALARSEALRRSDNRCSVASACVQLGRLYTARLDSAGRTRLPLVVRGRRPLRAGPPLDEAAPPAFRSNREGTGSP
jgi:hypothetical protein